MVSIFMPTNAYFGSFHACLCLLFATLPLTHASAQEIEATVETQGGFIIPIYDDEDRKVTEIRYDSATASAKDGVADLTNLEIHIFGEPTEPDSSWILRAPDCAFDQSDNTASSNGDVTLSTRDDSVSIRGEGFEWSQESETLKILRHEETLIRLKRAGDDTSTETRDLSVKSKSFEYDFANGAARYLDNVTAEIPKEFSLTAPSCVAFFDKNDSELRSITTEGGTRVHVWREGKETVATARSAVLRDPNSETERLEMVGDFTWKTPEIQGSGERGVVTVRNATLQVINHAKLEILEPNTTLATSVITSNTYRLTEEQIVFSGAVQLKRPTETMRCDSMTGQIDSDGRVDRLVARRAEVSFALENSNEPANAQADVLELDDLDGGAPQITLRRRASWSSNGLVGAGDEIYYDPKTERLMVVGSASAKYQDPEGQDESSQTVTITSESYSITPERAVFKGSPELNLPSWTWSADRLTLYPKDTWRRIDRAEGTGSSRIQRKARAQRVTTTDGLSMDNFDLESETATIRLDTDGTIRNIFARGSVRMQSDGRIGLGDETTFDAREGVARLTGRPTLTHPNGLKTIGLAETVVEYHLSDGAVNILGPYQTKIPNRAFRQSRKVSDEEEGERK